MPMTINIHLKAKPGGTVGNTPYLEIVLDSDLKEGTIALVDQDGAELEAILTGHSARALRRALSLVQDPDA